MTWKLAGVDDDTVGKDQAGRTEQAWKNRNSI